MYPDAYQPFDLETIVSCYRVMHPEAMQRLQSIYRGFDRVEAEIYARSFLSNPRHVNSVSGDPLGWIGHDSTRPFREKDAANTSLWKEIRGAREYFGRVQCRDNDGEQRWLTTMEKEQCLLALLEEARIAAKQPAPEHKGQPSPRGR